MKYCEDLKGRFAKAMFGYLLVHCALSACDSHLSSGEFTQQHHLTSSQLSDYNCINILDSIFLHCHPSTGNGGALLLETWSMQLTIDKCSFTNCVSGASGGALYFFAGYTKISSCCVYNCHAECGGFMLGNTYDAMIAISMSTMFACSASVGTVRVDQGRTDFRQINLTRNNVTAEGSAVSIHAEDDPDMHVNMCTFEDNFKASVFYRWSSQHDSITACNFVGNTAFSGIVHIRGEEVSHVSMTSCSFFRNDGVILLEESGTVTTSMTLCKMDVAQEALPSDVSVYDCQFSMTKVETVSIFFLNTAECQTAFYTQTTTDSDGSSSGLSGGAIAGISIAVIVIVLGLVAVGVFVYLRYRKANDEEAYSAIAEKT